MRVPTVASCVTVVLVGLLPGISQCAIVAPGWTLLETQPGTTVNGVPYNGVPLGTFDFGAPIGTQSVGNTDTIVERLATASVPTPPGSTTIPIELVALQLVSAVPVDFGAGLDFHYITLQSARGGPASTGTMTIDFVDPSGGTFDWLIGSLFYDIRKGSLTGPIIQSQVDSPRIPDTPWGRVPPPGSLTIEDVNVNLNNVDNTADFWPLAPIVELWPEVHTVVHVTAVALGDNFVGGVPEATSLVVWSVLVLGGLAVTGWRARIRQQPQWRSLLRAG